MFGNCSRWQLDQRLARLEVEIPENRLARPDRVDLAVAEASMIPATNPEACASQEMGPEVGTTPRIMPP
jgi:hypothetical protein